MREVAQRQGVRHRQGWSGRRESNPRLLLGRHVFTFCIYKQKYIHMGASLETLQVNCRGSLSGAGGGNRTRVSCLEGRGLTITQRPLGVGVDISWASGGQDASPAAEAYRRTTPFDRCHLPLRSPRKKPARIVVSKPRRGTHHHNLPIRACLDAWPGLGRQPAGASRPGRCRGR